MEAEGKAEDEAGVPNVAAEEADQEAAPEEAPRSAVRTGQPGVSMKQLVRWLLVPVVLAVLFMLIIQRPGTRCTHVGPRIRSTARVRGFTSSSDHPLFLLRASRGDWCRHGELGAELGAAKHAQGSWGVDQATEDASGKLKKQTTKGKGVFKGSEKEGKKEMRGGNVPAAKPKKGKEEEKMRGVRPAEKKKGKKGRGRGGVRSEKGEKGVQEKGRRASEAGEKQKKRGMPWRRSGKEAK